MAFQNQHWKVCGLIIENNQNEIENFLEKSQALENPHSFHHFNIENLRILVNALFEIGKLSLCKIINDGHRSMCRSGWTNFDPNLNTFDMSTVLPEHGVQEGVISEKENDYTTNPSFLFTVKANLSATFSQYISDFCDKCLYWVSIVRDLTRILQILFEAIFEKVATLKSLIIMLHILLIFGIFTHLHDFIRDCTFIYFEKKNLPTLLLETNIFTFFYNFLF